MKDIGVKKWLVWDGEKEFPFEYNTKKEATKDLKIFNKENKDYYWKKPYFLFKRTK